MSPVRLTFPLHQKTKGEKIRIHYNLYAHYIKYYNYKFLLVTILLISTTGLNSCTDDLDKFPENILTNDRQYSSVEGYKQSLRKQVQ